MKQKSTGAEQTRRTKNLSFIVLLFLLSACSKPLAEQPEENLAISIPIEWNNSSNLRTNITTGSFTATAAIAYCWGENVRFSGMIENKVNTTTDANGGVHYTRHWVIKGLDAVGVTSGATYTVIAGAEMFSVMDPVFSGGIPQPGSSGMVYIHQGTVVLENTVTGERVVARHVIKKHPQTGVVTSGWYCMGK